MMSRYAARAALVVASALVALVLVELALRLQPPVRLRKGWVLGHAERVLDSKLIYIHPSHKIPAYYHVPGEQPALVALGDSYTASFPVGRERSYPARLQEATDAAAASRSRGRPGRRRRTAGCGTSSQERVEPLPEDPRVAQMVK